MKKIFNAATTINFIKSLKIKFFNKELSFRLVLIFIYEGRFFTSKIYKNEIDFFLYQIKNPDIKNTIMKGKYIILRNNIFFKS